jgi:hypothetical protein
VVFFLYNEVPQDSKNNNMKKSQLADQSDQLSHGPITKRLKKESRIDMARGTKLQRTGIPCSRGETIE